MLQKTYHSIRTPERRGGIVDYKVPGRHSGQEKQVKAVLIPHFGSPEVLTIREVPQPEPGTDEVLIRVRASALNRADLLQRQGKYPAPAGAPAEIPGLEFAGEIEECGAAASQWKLGDNVFGIVGGGAHAEYVVSHERCVARIPDNLDFLEAAAVPEVFITAHDSLWTQAGLREGERVLIHAVGSGVGLAAVQLVRSKQAVPYGTSRTQDKIDGAREFGLEKGIILGETLKAFSNEVTGGRGFNVILDLIGGPYAGASVNLLALKGRLMLVGTVAGGKSEFNLAALLSKRARVIGTVLRSRPLEEKIAVTQAFANEVVPLLASGRVRPVIDREFAMEDVAQAHAYLESNGSFGKVVLRGF
jgi:NADPH:quinone reductase